MHHRSSAMTEQKQTVINKKARSTKLRLVGFCGADDSVHPHFLGLISQAYPFVEFGILFRPDKVSVVSSRVVLHLYYKEMH